MIKLNCKSLLRDPTTLENSNDIRTNAHTNDIRINTHH